MLKALERGGKAALRGALRLALARPRPPEGPLDPARVRRVLAVRPDARLGNLLLLVPALRLLKEAFPRARLEVLLSERYGEALSAEPSVDARIALWALPALPARGYDLAVDFSPHHAFSLSGAAWTAWSRAGRRVGFARGDAASFLDDLVMPPAERAFESDNLALLVRRAAPWLGPAAPLRPEWAFAPGEPEAGRKLWLSQGLDGESVALFVGARAEKRLDPAWFLELAGRISRQGRRAALLAGPAERGILEGLPLPPGAVLLAPLPLRAFAGAVACARAAVTADSGPMHLAAAVGTPTVGLFSHTEPWRFGYGSFPGHEVLETPGRHARPEEAAAALDRLLARPRTESAPGASGARRRPPPP